MIFVVKNKASLLRPVLRKPAGGVGGIGGIVGGGGTVAVGFGVAGGAVEVGDGVAVAPPPIFGGAYRTSRINSIPHDQNHQLHIAGISSFEGIARNQTEIIHSRSIRDNYATRQPDRPNHRSLTRQRTTEATASLASN